MISIAPASDIETCADLGRWFHYEHAGWMGEFDPASFRQHWDGVYKAGVGFIMKREITGAMVEAIGVYFHPDVMTGTPVASVSFWFVSPDLPRGFAAGLLFEEVLENVKQRGAKHLFFHVPLGAKRFERVMNYATKNGFRPSELQMVKEL